MTDALLKFCKLDQITTRLHMLSSSPKLALCDSLVLEQVMHTMHLLCRLSDALRETQDSMRVLNELQPKAIIQHSFMEEMAALCASTSALQSGFSVVVRNVELSSLPFLLERTCRCPSCGACNNHSPFPMNVDSSQRSVNMLSRRLLLFAAGLRPILN